MKRKPTKAAKSVKQSGQGGDPEKTLSLMRARSEFGLLKLIGFLTESGLTGCAIR